jgi:hypothetical protein
MSEYKESTGSFWKPKKEGETLDGIYISKEVNVGQNQSNLYYFERLDTQELVQVWGTTILDQRMVPVKIGQQVLITYKGLGEKGKGGKQAPHIWKVEYKDSDGISADVDGDIEEVFKK